MLLGYSKPGRWPKGAMISLHRNDRENVMRSQGEDCMMETHRGKLILCVTLGKALCMLDLNFSICKGSEFVQIHDSLVFALHGNYLRKFKMSPWPSHSLDIRISWGEVQTSVASQLSRWFHWAAELEKGWSSWSLDFTTLRGSQTSITWTFCSNQGSGLIPKLHNQNLHFNKSLPLPSNLYWNSKLWPRYSSIQLFQPTGLCLWYFSIRFGAHYKLPLIFQYKFWSSVPGTF